MLFYPPLLYALIPYCLRQAPMRCERPWALARDNTVLECMGVHSSRTKIWGWAVARRRCLNCSTISVQVPTSESEIPCIVSLPVLCFQPNEASPVVEKAYIVLENRPTRTLTARYLQFSSLAVHRICTVSEECCRRNYRLVSANLCCQMLWHLKHIRMITAIYMYVSSMTMRKNCEVDLQSPHKDFGW